jgi:hypothetical protein
MTIRFSCSCGALFEVPDDLAGMPGKCRNCGSEMTIPADQRLEPTQDSPDAEPVQPEPETARESEPQQPVPFRYCPYCGEPQYKPGGLCPTCLRRHNPKPVPTPDPVSLNPADWVLTTAFAPFGLLHGFVILLLGYRKGLPMMGIATASLAVWWLIWLVFMWMK